MMFGRRGFGGGDDGVGVRDAATVADLNALQNAVTERTLDITRDQAANALRNESGQQALQQGITNAAFGLQNGQCDIRQAVSDCCCQLGISIKDVEKAICDCCCQLGIGQKDIINAVQATACDTQHQVQVGFAQLNTTICNESNATRTVVHAEGESTRALINTHRMEDLQNQLNICRDELSNQQQTLHIERTIREQCGNHWGGRGFEAAPTGKK